MTAQGRRLFRLLTFNTYQALSAYVAFSVWIVYTSVFAYKLSRLYVNCSIYISLFETAIINLIHMFNHLESSIISAMLVQRKFPVSVSPIFGRGDEFRFVWCIVSIVNSLDIKRMARTMSRFLTPYTKLWKRNCKKRHYITVICISFFLWVCSTYWKLNVALILLVDILTIYKKLFE